MYKRQAQCIVDDDVSKMADIRKANGGKPLLHASVSAKYTMRSDRAQNSRTEALNLIRNRKGHLPHIVVVTAEPMPNRLASLASVSYTHLSDALCKLLDDMMSADQAPPQYTEEENLFYKIQHRLSRLYEVLRESKSSIAKERADLQELISDISHQVKTPIANLKMLDATLLEQTVSPEKQKEFLLAMDLSLIHI